MRGLRRVWMIAGVLAWVGAWGQWMAGQEPAPVQQPVPKPLVQEIVDAWKKAGAQVGWMRPRFSLRVFRDGADPLPAFRFSFLDPAGWEPGMIGSLPAPPVPFGLKLSGKGVTDAGLKELTGLNQLRSLELSGTQVADAGLRELAGLKELQALYLDGTRVSDEGLRHLAGLKQLQMLDLSRTQVTDAGLKQLAGLTELRWLYLSRTRVTDAGLRHLARLKQLQSLGLLETRVTDAGLKELAALKQLRWLDLQGTQVTSAGLKELAGMKLESLLIPCSAQTDLGLKHYLQAIEPRTELHLTGWRITDAG